jgi:hypothetical protein
MPKLTFLLSALLLGVPAAKAIDDTDPEPPRPGPVFMKLVAKKATYKLDLQGSTVAEYTKAARAGKAPPIRLDLELVIINTSKTPIRVRTAGATSRLTLALKGPGVVDSDKVRLEKMAGPKKNGKASTAYAILKPGEKVSIPVESLTSNTTSATGQHHYWTQPGDYTLEATYRTGFYLDYNPNAHTKLTYLEPKASAIKLRVEK